MSWAALGAMLVAAVAFAQVDAIWMRHLGRRSGAHAGRGEILFYAERGGEPFFTVPWWMA